MSQVKEVNLLTHGEVHKKIIERPPKIRSTYDILGPGNKYRDEIFAIYNKKRTQFLEACKQYNKLNQETLICNKTRLLGDYRNNLNCEFLNEDEESKSEEESPGDLLRKRTERPIHEVVMPKHHPCTMEPWVRRHLKLDRFIWAARTVILKNRLLKVLEKLKALTPEDVEILDDMNLAVFNVSFPEIFQPFL